MTVFQKRTVKLWKLKRSSNKISKKKVRKRETELDVYFIFQMYLIQDKTLLGLMASIGPILESLEFLYII